MEDRKFKHWVGVVHINNEETTGHIHLKRRETEWPESEALTTLGNLLKGPFVKMIVDEKWALVNVNSIRKVTLTYKE